MECEVAFIKNVINATASIKAQLRSSCQLNLISFRRHNQ